jgi:hypothetical protein
MFGKQPAKRRPYGGIVVCNEDTFSGHSGKPSNFCARSAYRIACNKQLSQYYFSNCYALQRGRRRGAMDLTSGNFSFFLLFAVRDIQFFTAGSHTAGKQMEVLNLTEIWWT